MAYKQLKFICHSAGDWEVQDKSASRLSVWWRYFWFIDGYLFIVFDMADRAKGLSEFSFTNDANFIYEGPAHDLITFQRPYPKHHHFGDLALIYEFWEYMVYNTDQLKTSQRLYKLRLRKGMFLVSCFADWLVKVEGCKAATLGLVKAVYNGKKWNSVQRDIMKTKMEKVREREIISGNERELMNYGNPLDNLYFPVMATR